jgi:hypothetical protein
MHWNFGAYRSWLLQGRARPYRCSPTYPLLEAIPIEGVLKVILPLCGILGNMFGSEGLR